MGFGNDFVEYGIHASGVGVVEEKSFQGAVRSKGLVDKLWPQC